MKNKKNNKVKKIVVGIILVIVSGIVIFNTIKINDTLYAKSLIDTIEQDDMEKFQKLLKKGGNVNAGYYYGIYRGIDNPLHRAVGNERYDMAKMLIEAGANPNKRVSGGDTTLHRAVAHLKNNPDLLPFVQYLLDHGANIKLKNEDNEGVLCFLISWLETEKEIKEYDYKILEYFQYFQDLGAKLEDSSYGNVIFDVCRRNNLPLVKYLIEEQHLDINMKDKRGSTLLMSYAYAYCSYDGKEIYFQNMDVFRYLLEMGADPTIKNEANKTVYDIATENNAIDLLKILEQYQ